MEDFYFSILKKAEKRGLFNTFNAASILKKYLKKSPVYKTKPTNWQNVPELLLRPLVERKYIRLIKFNEDIINDAPDNWIDLLVAIISIEPEGLLFLFEKKKIRQQTWTNRLTFIFIAVTFIIGSVNIYYSRSPSCPKLDNNSQSDSIKQKDQCIPILKQDSLQPTPKPQNTQPTHPKSPQ